MPEEPADGADALISTLDVLDADDEDARRTVGDLVDRLERRGFGPILIALSGFLLLPTGMIPGAPAVVGLLMLLTGGQMLFGLRTPWLPGRLREIEAPTGLMNAAVRRTRPMVHRLRWLVAARLSPLVENAVMARAIALGVMCAGLIVIPFGFIPFLPFVVSLPVLCFGVGLAARDGLFALAGFAAFAPVIWMLAAQGG
jgi:hypothetical protein